MWNNIFKITIIFLNFVRLTKDNSIFLNKNSEISIALYINNLLIFLEKITAINNIKIALQKVYKIKNLSEIDTFLRIQIQ